MIAAIDRNRVLGSASGGIPWDLPRDREHFRRYARSKWMALGRATYEEMTGWFASQCPIIISRRSDFSPCHPSHRVAHSITAAIELARDQGADELVISGGASIYEASIPYADRIILTRVDHSAGGDLTFPEFESNPCWSLRSRNRFPPDHENIHAISIEVWQKRR